MAGRRRSGPCTTQLSVRSYENANLSGLNSIGNRLGDPMAHSGGFSVDVGISGNEGIWPIENRNGTEPLLITAIDVAHDVRQQAICSLANLMRSPIVHFQYLCVSAHVDTKRGPGKWLLKNALSEIASKEYCVRSCRCD